MTLNQLNKRLNLMRISKNYYDESDEEYFLEVDVKYPKNLHNLQNDLPFLTEKVKIEKIEKLVANLHDKEEYVRHIRNLRHVLNHTSPSVKEGT